MRKDDGVFAAKMLIARMPRDPGESQNLWASVLDTAAWVGHERMMRAAFKFMTTTGKLHLWQVMILSVDVHLRSSA